MESKNPRTVQIELDAQSVKKVKEALHKLCELATFLCISIDPFEPQDSAPKLASRPRAKGRRPSRRK